MEQVRYTIGVDMGGSHIRMGLVAEGRVIDAEEFKVDASLGLAPYLEQFGRSIDTLITRNSVPGIAGVGISFPGLVDVRHKKVTATFGKYDDIKEIDFEKWIEDKWHCPYFIDLDARMSAVGEWKYGAGRGYDSIVMMTLGTGIGTAVINEQQVFRGKHFQAGSFGGHFIVDLEGPACSCGGHGCIEAHTGTWSINQQAKTDAAYEHSLLRAYDSVGYRELFQAASKGDALASRLKKKSLDVWAAGVISYIHAYDPEIVIIGGSVMKSADLILPYIQDAVDKKAVTPWGKVKVTAGQLLEDSAILGAAQCLIEGI